jgi:hypothetical protein
MTYITYSYNEIHMFISLKCSFVISISALYSRLRVSVSKSVLSLRPLHEASACLCCLSNGTRYNVGRRCNDVMCSALLLGAEFLYECGLL